MPPAVAVAEPWTRQRPPSPRYPRSDGRSFARLPSEEPRSPFGGALRPGVNLIAHWEKRWAGLLAATAELTAADAFGVDCAGPWSHLVVVLKETGASLRAHATGKSVAGSPDTPHRMYFVPPNTPFRVQASGLGAVRVLSLQFCQDTLRDLIGNDFQPDLPRSPRMGFVDDRLFALAGLVESECRRREPTSTLLATSLSISLLSLLIGLEPCPRPQPFSGGLTARQLNAVTHYLEDHLPERIDPHALARLARLSTSHFHRAFKASTGMPPHTWLTHERIRRAKTLLAGGEIALAEIALETGFSDQPHFTRVFTRLVGMTPGAWRRSTAN